MIVSLGRKLSAALLGLLLAVSASGASAQAADSAVLIMYHRFGQNDYPTTNVRIAQFEKHLEALTSDRYTVLPVPEIVRKIRNGTALPDHTVGITIDDAFRSVYESAWPRLRDAGLPFTLFVATKPVNEGHSDYMSWDQVKELHDNGVTIAAHGVGHLHMAALPEARTQREIQQSIVEIAQHTGTRPKFFAYPYGETSLTMMEQVRGADIVAAFGQHSGAMTAAHNPFYLPRFPINERYGDMSRFNQVVNSLGLAVTDMTPADPLLGNAPGDNPPAIGFTLPRGLKRARELACYHSITGKVEQMERLGPSRVELRFGKPFPTGRTRVNCTVPGPDGRWRWLGMQFYTKP